MFLMKCGSFDSRSVCGLFISVWDGLGWKFIRIMFVFVVMFCVVMCIMLRMFFGLCVCEFIECDGLMYIGMCVRCLIIGMCVKFMKLWCGLFMCVFILCSLNIMCWLFLFVRYLVVFSDLFKVMLKLCLIRIGKLCCCFIVLSSLKFCVLCVLICSIMLIGLLVFVSVVWIFVMCDLWVIFIVIILILCLLVILNI